MKANENTIQQLRAAGTFVYDMSMIGTYMWCPRAFEHAHEHGLKRKNEPPATGREFGRCLHLALEHWHNTRNEPDSTRIFEEAFLPHEPQPKLGKSGKLIYPIHTIILGASLLNEYYAKYSNDARKVIGNELAIAEELREGVYMAGRLDLILEKSIDKLVIQDHKTSKYYNDFTTVPNAQFMNYKFLAQKFTGQKVSCELDMIGVSKTADVSTLLYRLPIEYTDWQMKQWEESAVTWTERINHSRNNHEWPQSWSCKPYFSDCAYLPLCSSPNQHAEESLKGSLYEVKFWDPFHVE